MWKKKQKKSKQKVGGASEPQGQLRFAAMQRCSVRRTIWKLQVVITQKTKNKKKERKKKKRWKENRSFSRPMRNERIPEQEPTEAIWYIKIVIFLYSVSVLFPFVEGYSRAQIFVFPFFFCFFLPVFSLGVNHFRLAPLWYCWTNRVWSYCNNKCCFLDVKPHCRWRTKSIRHKF